MKKPIKTYLQLAAYAANPPRLRASKHVTADYKLGRKEAALAIKSLPELKANERIISVQQDGSNKCKRYTVVATTYDDARQIAFALDGGWGQDRNASGLLNLAKCYTRIIK